MTDKILTGEKVRLVVTNIEQDAKLLAEWDRDSEYQRLLNGDPANLFAPGKIKEFFEKEIGSMAFFIIERIEDGKRIGLIDLSGFNYAARNAWVGIGIGERDLWGQGYGTDAMRVLLRYAFEQMNLNRVTLNVFEFNQRGYKSYEKAGFKLEGRLSKVLVKGGKRYDLIFMGCLRHDWEALQPASPQNYW